MQRKFKSWVNIMKLKYPHIEEKINQIIKDKLPVYASKDDYNYVIHTIKNLL